MLDKREVIGLVLIFGALAVLALGAYAFGIPLCMFHRLTGIPCPLCGTTRACVSLLHGDVASALRINPLAVVAMVVGPLVLWSMTRRGNWPTVLVRAARFLAWAAVLLNWACLVCSGK